MACLSTSGRQGLLVAVGGRRYRTQKFLCQLFLQHNVGRFASSSAPDAALKRVTSASLSSSSSSRSSPSSSSPSLSPSPSPSPSLSSSSLSSSSSSSLSSPSSSTLQVRPQRHFHGLNGAASSTIFASKDYLGLVPPAHTHVGDSNGNGHGNGNANANANTAIKCLTCSSRSESANSAAPSKTQCRQYSSVHTQQPAGPVRELQIDPYIIVDEELKYFYDDVRDLLQQGTTQAELDTIATYYFDGQGKALRPMVTLLMAKALNYHLNKESSKVMHEQRQIALFSEMVHSASLVHDDVIDQSDFRRGKPSVNALWNHKKVTMAGDYILSIASIMIARLKSDDVTIVLSQILTDLVQGEFMQLGSRETENERFAHYLTKTYRKTASLIANTLKAVALIAQAGENMTELAFQYGRNIGLAFQLVDDMLDFVSSAETMGKPTAADLKLGLATAPVLFACEKYPELNPMIMRRFSEPGDVERAFDLVHKSHGLEQTRFLAKKHCIEAIRLSQEMAESPYQKGLQVVADLVINRMK